MAGTSIAASLGSGSGIDTVSLVKALVDAQFAAKTSQIKQRDDTLSAQISGLSSLKGTITGFASALSSLTRGGTLITSPTSSNSVVAKVSSLNGSAVGNVAASLEVSQIAKPQSAATNIIADRTAPIGTGSFTLTFGTATVADGAMTGFTAGAATPITINIDSAHQNLNGIAAAINAKNAGVTASIVTDAGGARLVLKGATGASQAFTLQSGDAGLSDLNIGVGATGSRVGSVAQDAIVKLDGVEVRRASNTITNLIENVKVEIAGEGTTAIGTSAPTAAIGQAVNDFVATYNQVLAVLKEQTDPKTGPLRGDPAAQTLLRSLGRLPSTMLATGDGSAPRTLAEIGVATNRDGSLRVDNTRLNTALNKYPTAIEAMFRDGKGASENGLSAALNAISNAATAADTGLGASESRYTKARSILADQSDQASIQAEQMSTRLTAQFAKMDARVAAYKSTQTFLENQIKAWNKS